LPFGEGEDDLIPSVMTQFPDYVSQIGMITIELANLESSLADLLGAILGVGADVAHAIYFTPKAVIPRVEVLINVQKALHPDEELDKEEMQEIRKKLRNVCGRATAVMGKRNDLMHAMWGSDGQNGVHFSSLPLKKYGYKAAVVQELERIVDDMRRLIGDVKHLEATIDVYRAEDSGEDEI